MGGRSFLFSAIIIVLTCLHPLSNPEEMFVTSGKLSENSEIPVDDSENTFAENNNQNRFSDLDGQGVVIAVADTGVDMDHSCFRNSTNEVGSPSEAHRKIVFLNDTIDDWDTRGHQQYRHGTHIAGILACDPLNGDEVMKSMSSGAKLLVQDIVNESGWVPPENVAELLAESSKYGATINSWSWGDNSVDYTNRSRDIDEYTLENPWSLVFVAAGNNGRTVLEPANSYNVVSVSASDLESNGSVWPSSSKGPDVNGRRGIFISSPGVGIVSAKADGERLSMNNDSYSNTGTSMATPMAASFTALLQQMVVENFGFHPSAPMLKSMLAYSGDGLQVDYPDSSQGYGRPNLDNFNNDFQIIDSYQIENWTSIIEERGYDLDSLKMNPWDGSGANGPFLSQNDSWSKLYRPVHGEDVKIVMSYNARSADYEIDDLRLIVRTDDGRFAVDDNFSRRGSSPLYYESWKSPLSMNSSNETTVMIKIPYHHISDCEWLSVEVFAKSVNNGSNTGMLGLEGDKIGFGMIIGGLQDLTENNAPVITVIDQPERNDNFSHNFSISANIFDEESDVFEVTFRAISNDYIIDFDNCGGFYNTTRTVFCNISIDRDFLPMHINSHGWYIEITVTDDNNSIWTSAKSSNHTTDNFTIWVVSQLADEEVFYEDARNNDGDDGFSLILVGIFGVIFGCVVGASVMFRNLNRNSSREVLSPFSQEEE